MSSVWRTCSRIRQKIAELKLDWRTYFDVWDVQNTGLVSEKIFGGFLKEELSKIMEISDEELQELLEYFRADSQTTNYRQLQKVVIPDYFSKWAQEAEFMHRNRLSKVEAAKLEILLQKLSCLLATKELNLRPFFQDYELLAKSNGTVTFEHLFRVLGFLGIKICDEDYPILLKRYMKDSYTFNYLAFLADVEEKRPSKRPQGPPDHIISAKVSRLPRPEIGKVDFGDVMNVHSSYHPALWKPRDPFQVEDAMKRIKRFLLSQPTRVEEFFEKFDVHHRGSVTNFQFKRGLDAMGVSGLRRLPLTTEETEDLAKAFADPRDPSQVSWRRFVDELNTVYAVKNLHRKPWEIVKVPPDEIKTLPASGSEWSREVAQRFSESLKTAILKIQKTITKKKLHVKPWFKDFDSHRNNHVSRDQMRRGLDMIGSPISEEEVKALEKRFCDDLGFNYKDFLLEVEREEPKPSQKPSIQTSKVEEKPLNIIQILAKIKNQAVKKHLRIDELMKDFDVHQEREITQSQFKRSLKTAGVSLTDYEVDVVCKTFASRKDHEKVDFIKFTETIEGAWRKLHKNPLLTPIKDIPCDENEDSFLNFEERTLLSKTLQKLSKFPDVVFNLSEPLKDFDSNNEGLVTPHQLLQVLTVRQLSNLLSSREFGLILKTFGVKRGLETRFKYRDFLITLDHISRARSEM